MAGKKQTDKNAAPLVVLFVEGDTDLVFFNALLQYYRGVSVTPVNAAQVVNLQSVTRYASKMMSKLQNDIMPSTKLKGRRVEAVCCSYDTDVFEAGVQVVDWALVEKKVRKLGIASFCRVGVQSMIEDWLLDDVAGLCSFLKLKQVPSSVSGRTGYEKLVSLFAKAGMKYSKGMSVASFLGSLDMGAIRGKRKAVLKGDQGDLWSNLNGVLLVIQYFLFYLPGNKGVQFAKDVKRLMNVHRKEDIMDIVGYLNDVPWLEEKL